MSKNLFFNSSLVTKNQREKLLKQKSILIWFTGLSGSGKTTIANQINLKLYEMGYNSYGLDGDNIRLGINSDLNFSKEGRKENLRRIGEVSRLMLDSGIIVCASFISPFKIDRDKVRNLVGSGNFVEIYIKTSIDICIQRDSKGLYKKALNGEIDNFTGVSSPYQVPENPEIIIDTSINSVEQSVELILEYILPKIKI